MDCMILDLSADQISGESQLEGYENMIELIGYTLGSAQQDASGVDRKPSVGANERELTVTKYVDVSSCALMHRCTQGQRFAEARLILGQKEGTKVTVGRIYTLREVLIDNIAVDGGEGIPRETVTLRCRSIS